MFKGNSVIFENNRTNRKKCAIIEARIQKRPPKEEGKGKAMNRIVLITGASEGYGKATAKAFKENGDTVIMTAMEGQLQSIKDILE